MCSGGECGNFHERDRYAKAKVRYEEIFRKKLPHYTGHRVRIH